MVEWLQRDPRFELISIRDYLQTFPPDPAQGVHIEPGSWSGADNGDPQFMKWFSRYHESYSPDLNSWAVLTALHNTVHSLEDAGYAGAVLEDIQRLMFTAETSCYWYWTGQTEWDSQVTLAANLALAQARGQVDALLSAGTERTPPTIFPPWVTPENPGGKRWGQGCLISAPREAVVHTFVYDISDVKRVTLTLRTVNGELHIDMKGHGPYPCRSGATATSRYYTADLPVGVGDIFFFVESEDAKGNVARSSLESIHLA